MKNDRYPHLWVMNHNILVHYHSLSSCCFSLRRRGGPSWSGRRRRWTCPASLRSVSGHTVTPRVCEGCGLVEDHLIMTLQASGAVIRTPGLNCLPPAWLAKHPSITGTPTTPCHPWTPPPPLTPPPPPSHTRNCRSPNLKPPFLKPPPSSYSPARAQTSSFPLTSSAVSPEKKKTWSLCTSAGAAPVNPSVSPGVENPTQNPPPPPLENSSPLKIVPPSHQGGPPPPQISYRPYVQSIRWSQV